MDPVRRLSYIPKLSYTSRMDRGALSTTRRSPNLRLTRQHSMRGVNFLNFRAPQPFDSALSPR